MEEQEQPVVREQKQKDPTRNLRIAFFALCIVFALLAVLGAYLLSGVLQTSFASSGMYPIL